MFVYAPWFVTYTSAIPIEAYVLASLLTLTNIIVGICSACNQKATAYSF